MAVSDRVEAAEGPAALPGLVAQRVAVAQALVVAQRLPAGLGAAAVRLAGAEPPASAVRQA